MSQQGGGPGKTTRRQRAVAAVVIAVLGVIAGAVFAAFNPPAPTSETLVVTPVTNVPAAQVAIADSDLVLAGALRRIDLPTSLASLRRQVRVSSVTDRVIMISAQAPTAATADGIANAVASSYVAYYSNSPRRFQAQMLSRAAVVSGPPLSHRLPVPSGLGALLGALIGATAVITPRRSGGGRIGAGQLPA